MYDVSDILGGVTARLREWQTFDLRKGAYLAEVNVPMMNTISKFTNMPIVPKLARLARFNT